MYQICCLYMYIYTYIHICMYMYVKPLVCFIDLIIVEGIKTIYVRKGIHMWMY